MEKRSKVIALPVVIVLGITLAWWLARLMLCPVGGGAAVVVQVPRGASAGEVGQILVEQGIIRSALGFRMLARVTGRAGSLKPGAYQVAPSMSPPAIMGKMARGEICGRWVTLPEGFTIQQIAKRLEAEGFGDAGRFSERAYCDGASFPTSFPHPAQSLEGYLFPDTYLLSIGSSEDAIIQEMLDCFGRKVADPLASHVAESGMSLHQIMTLASLIEREARVPKDRPLISAVLHNRLRRGMRLECDATVLYALGGHKDRVMYVDLAVDSPYNTYRYEGLPPGPIANPGLASIEAALHPARTDYLYYVALPDGSHIFSRTFAEHQHARQVVRGEDGHQAR